MDDKLKKEFIKLIVQALDEVVMPAIDDLEQKMDQRFEKMDQRFDGVDQRFDGMDSKIDRVIDNQIVCNNTLNDHEKRIKKLETKQTILSS